MKTQQESRNGVVLIGGGPAGLTAAYELAKNGITPLVLEKAHIVGGLARTEQYKGFRFDMGGHRFFTKSPVVSRMWSELLGEDFLRRQRLSRIYYRSRFFHYPLKIANVLIGLGPVETLFILASYLRWQLFPYRREDTFEQWVTNRFGKRLFCTFFKTYTEKVWGIPCSELRAEWAAQRIKDLSVKTILLDAIRRRNGAVKSLIQAFDYPRLGPGMLWDLVREKVESCGGRVQRNAEVVGVRRDGNRLVGLDVSCDGRVETVHGDYFISSMPLTSLVQQLDPPPPPEVLEAAGRLRYRDFLTVCLIVDKEGLFPDNWIYVHEPKVKVGRIQNFGNWSPDMVPEAGKSSLGLEYFCNEGDDLWSCSDAELIELAKDEICHLGLAERDDIEDGCVFRVPKSYPVYDSSCAAQLSILREYVAGLENVQTIGRNGLHRYNNQDHSMMTAILAVKNFTQGETNDVWSVNADAEYHEEVRTEPEDAPARAPEREVLPRPAPVGAGTGVPSPEPGSSSSRRQWGGLMVPAYVAVCLGLLLGAVGWALASPASPTARSADRLLEWLPAGLLTLASLLSFGVMFRLPTPKAAGWLFFSCLCVFFAGEEVSWGREEVVAAGNNLGYVSHDLHSYVLDFAAGRLAHNGGMIPVALFVAAAGMAWLLFGIGRRRIVALLRDTWCRLPLRFLGLGLTMLALAFSLAILRATQGQDAGWQRRFEEMFECFAATALLFAVFAKIRLQRLPRADVKGNPVV